MKFDIKLGEYGKIIENALAAYMDRFPSDSLYNNVIEAMKYSLLDGGKRIRPVLTLAFAEINGCDVQKAVAFACAVEMIHTYSLIHDDLPCMDNDDMRRGKPSCHIKYGEDTALLAGDGLLTYAFEIMASSVKNGISANFVVKAVTLLSGYSGVNGMIGGQCIDLASEGKAVDEFTIMEMDMKKTVALISVACQLGCVAAGGDENKQRMAKDYAENVGMAFQIRDDILDVISNTETLGKRVGADAENEKRNYISFYGLEKCNLLVNDYTQKAKKTLLNFDGDKEFLSDLADYLSGRKN